MILLFISTGCVYCCVEYSSYLEDNVWKNINYLSKCRLIRRHRQYKNHFGITVRVLSIRWVLYLPEVQRTAELAANKFALIKRQQHVRCICVRGTVHTVGWRGRQTSTNGCSLFQVVILSLILRGVRDIQLASGRINN